MRGLHVLLGGLFALGVIGMTGLLIFHFDRIPDKPLSSLLAYLFFLCLIGFFCVYCFLEGYYRPTTIHIAADGSFWRLSALLRRTRVIRLSDVEAYSRCTMENRFTSWPGLILYLKSGSVEELTERSLRTLAPLVDSLSKTGVKCVGRESTWYPFRKFEYDFRK